MGFFGRTKPQSATAKPVVSERRSLIYISLWDYRYEFKTRYLGKILATFLFILTLIELAGPIKDFLPEQKKPLLHFGIAGLLLATAILIVWRHHREHVRTERYEGLLNSHMVQLEKLVTPAKPFTSQDAIALLDTLVETVNDRRHRALFTATILKRVVKDGEPFKIYAQNSQNKFQPEFTVDATESVAGKVIETDKKTPRALMYVPHTKYIHGVVITWEKDPKVFMKRQTAVSAYSDVTSTKDPDVQKCLLCIAIPLQQLGKRPEDPDTAAVLCLSGRKKDCMGALDFTALKLMAVLLSHAMKNYS